MTTIYLFVLVIITMSFKLIRYFLTLSFRTEAVGDLKAGKGNMQQKVQKQNCIKVNSSSKGAPQIVFPVFRSAGGGLALSLPPDKSACYFNLTLPY